LCLACALGIANARQHVRNGICHTHEIGRSRPVVLTNWH
jgi:hypothetical protein